MKLTPAVCLYSFLLFFLFSFAFFSHFCSGKMSEDSLPYIFSSDNPSPLMPPSQPLRLIDLFDTF